MAYLSSDLMAAVKRYSSVPTSQVTFQAADFYALGDDSIRAKIVPLVIKHMSEYYVKPYNYSIQNGVSAYAIPPRAINSMLRSVQLVGMADPDSRVNLQQLAIEDLYAGLAGSTGILVKKSGFYIEGNNIVLYPTPVSTALNTLRLNYFIRPNQLVDPTACALIQSVNTGANTITCASVPSTWSTANILDIVKAQPGFDCMAIDQAITNIAGGVITVSSTLPTTISAGDYVCLAGQSCVVQVPVELQPLLTQYVVVRVLAAQGDQNGLKSALAELEALEKNASLLLAPRVQGSVRRIVNSRSIARLV